MTRTLSALLVAAIFCAPAVAQSADAGVGTVLAGPIDVDTLSGNNGHLGATYLPFTNTILVSARGLGTVIDPPHSLYELTLPAAGSTSSVLLNTYQQQGPTDPLVNPWGHRDGTTDLGTLFITGDEVGVYAYDQSLGLAPVTGNIIWIADNGPVVSTATWPLPPVNTNTRGLAFNPSGNGGNGSLWTANFGSNLVEFDIDGTVLNTFTWNGAWSIYGLTYDPQTGMLWGNSSPNAGNLVEIDPATGTETGLIIRREVTGSTQGGLGIINGAAAQAAYGVESALIGMDQSTPDQISIYRLHRYASLNAFDETELRAEFSAQGGTLTGTRINVGGTYTVPSQFQLELFNRSPLAANLPALVLWNLLGDAAVNGNTLGVPEFISVNNLSVPAQTGLSFTIGDGFALAGLAAPDVIGGGGVLPANGAITPVFPSPDLMVPGSQMRFQGLVFEPNAGALGVNATNTVDMTFASPLNLCSPQGALVETIGANNFVPLGNAGAGYWTVTNTNAAGGPSIDSVSFDMLTSSNVAWANAAGVFDYDQVLSATTNGEAFVNGNSALTGCAGTFVGGTDVTTGLAYDVLNSFGPGAIVGAVACDPAAFSGWDTTNDLGGACTDVNMRFASFGPGTSINFDCDTDGGAGVNGSAMAGIVVTIFWDNGCVTLGEIAADPANANRGFIAL